MGRIVDLFGEVAAEAEEGTEGLVLSPDAWDRLRGEWQDEDIEDALNLVQESLLQGELVDSADSLSARLVELLGGFGAEASFAQAAAGRGAVSIEEIAQLTRRVARLEEVLEIFRDGSPPDRAGFDALQRRLADLGIEREMEEGRGSPGDDPDE
jgi:uncharacterized protein with von Willebrand factor type A (vWA) domain